VAFTLLAFGRWKEEGLGRPVVKVVFNPIEMEE
jgi:hypothetical protein